MKIWFNSLTPGCVRSPQDMIYYFSEKYFPSHKKLAALHEIFNFVQIEEENLPQTWGRLLELLSALPDHHLKKNEILDIFYNRLTDASRDLIRPFCIMLLYRYLLHYGLLFHFMSQYVWLFSLILQGLHKEGECRQLEFWAGKAANIRDLFCATPKVLKLHGTS